MNKQYFNHLIHQFDILLNTWHGSVQCAN